MAASNKAALVPSIPNRMRTFNIALAALMLTSVQAAQAQIRSEQNKVLWAGLDNGLHIAEPGWEPGELRVSVLEGHAINRLDGEGLYAIAKTADEQVATIRVEGVRNGQVVELRQQRFQFVPIPDPIAVFAGYGALCQTHRITREELAAHDRLAIAMGAFDVFMAERGIPIPIKEFTLSIFSADRNHVTEYRSRPDSPDQYDARTGARLPSPSELPAYNRLTAEMRRALQALPAGRFFSFSEIVIELPDGSLRTLPPLVFELAGG